MSGQREFKSSLPGRPFIPVATASLGQREIDCVLEALREGEISGTTGQYVTRFERDFAKYCECSHGVATSSGTTALHLALAMLGIGPGDEVLASTLTNMATFFAVLYQGATPVPVDVDEDTGNLDPTELDRLVTPRTKAIIVVHLYGHPADMDPILEIARRHHLSVIEDAAEAHGALYKGRKVGSLGDIGCFSFYANKILTTGEGGMVVTNNAGIAEYARSARSLCYGTKARFMHTGVGFNYRMTNLQAAIGCAQLEKIEKTIDGKRRTARFYTTYLRDVAELQLPVEKLYARNVYWMCHVILKDPSRNRRDTMMERLRGLGIDTRPSFIPYNLQEVFIRKGMTHPELCPIANRISQGGFYLPSSPDLGEEDISYVATQLKEALWQSRS